MQICSAAIEPRAGPERAVLRFPGTRVKMRRRTSVWALIRFALSRGVDGQGPARVTAAPEPGNARKLAQRRG